MTTTSVFDPVDLDAIRKVPARAAAIQAELDDMAALFDRLAAAGYLEANSAVTYLGDELEWLTGVESGTDSVLERLLVVGKDMAVHDFVFLHVTDQRMSRNEFLDSELRILPDRQRAFKEFSDQFRAANPELTARIDSLDARLEEAYQTYPDPADTPNATGLTEAAMKAFQAMTDAREQTGPEYQALGPEILQALREMVGAPSLA